MYGVIGVECTNTSIISTAQQQHIYLPTGAFYYYILFVLAFLRPSGTTVGPTLWERQLQLLRLFGHGGLGVSSV